MPYTIVKHPKGRGWAVKNKETGKLRNPKTPHKTKSAARRQIKAIGANK